MPDRETDKEACLRLCDEIENAIGKGKFDVAFERSVRLGTGATLIDKANPETEGYCARAADALSLQISVRNVEAAQQLLTAVRMMISSEEEAAQIFIDFARDLIGSA